MVCVTPITPSAIGGACLHAPFSGGCQRRQPRVRTACRSSHATPSAQRDSSPVVSNAQLGRRQLMAAAAAALAAAPAAAAGAAEAVCDRITQDAAAIQQQRSGLRLLKSQVYYPPWLFGEWSATATFKHTDFSNGVPPILAVHSMQAAIPPVAEGDSKQYTLRFYSTLPDTFKNQVKMNVGMLPEDATVADRSFNSAAAANAFAGYQVVQDSSYDPRASPDRQRLLLQPAGGAPYAVELTLTELSGGADDADASRFCTIESYSEEQPGGQSTEYQFLTEYTLVAAGHVRARQREVYFGPSRGALGILGGRPAVAVFDYTLDMLRAPPPSDAGRAEACVETPKGFTQCS